jgi:molecular chaperone DnaJ
MADFYELLGVPRDAAPDAIKRAYRKRARELHPDANPGNPAAEEQFKELARAYEVLSDPDTKARYDRGGESALGGAAGSGDFFGGGGGLGDLFDAFFGGGGGSPFGGQRGPAGPPRGQDLEVVADLSFEQAVFGATVPVNVRTAVVCEDCGGTGAGSNTKPVMCADCNGSGQVRTVRQGLIQMVSTRPCQRCSGTGQVIATPCASCRADGRVVTEKTYEVNVPAGVDQGSTLRLTGRGAVGPRGGGAGDLYVHLRVARHERFERDGADLVTTVPISIAQAALGVTITLPTLDGDEELVVPAGTQPGRQFVLRGRGVPQVHGRGRGDLRAIIRVEIPTKLSASESELLRRYAEERGEEVHPPDKGVLSRLKSAFK